MDPGDIAEANLRIATGQLQTQIFQTVANVIAVSLTFFTLCWWVIQHYLIYKRGHVAYEHLVRDYSQRMRFPLPPADLSALHQRVSHLAMSDLQRDMDVLIMELRMRPQRLRVQYTMEDLKEIFEFPEERASPV